MESNQFCWETGAAKTVLKVNPHNSGEPWQSNDHLIIYTIIYNTSN